MEQDLVNLIYGCLLHDIGKVVQRGYPNNTVFEPEYHHHSYIGTKFMHEVSIQDQGRFSYDLNDEQNNEGDDNFKKILQCITYHHGKFMNHLNDNDTYLPYICYIADNISAASDRRNSDNAENIYGWNNGTRLESVFNVFGENVDGENIKWPSQMLDDTEDNSLLPNSDDETFSRDNYETITQKIFDKLKEIFKSKESFNEGNLDSFMTLLETTLSFVPSDTARENKNDISLFNHLKLTTAFASCIYYYLKEQDNVNYKDKLVKNANEFYNENAFALCSFDFSGIQDFIYQIVSEGAAKTLRSRSFYLEILTQVIVDDLLKTIDLSRANLLYTGGGHGYLLVPNVDSIKKKICNFEKNINKHLREKFQNKLFIAFGIKDFSSSEIMQIGNESYSDGKLKEIYKAVSKEISLKKLSRYSADEIRELNEKGKNKGRECIVCHVVDENNSQRCKFCESLIEFSDNLVGNGGSEVEFNGLFVVSNSENNNSIHLYNDKYLTFYKNEKELPDNIDDLKIYSKNRFLISKVQGVTLYVGSYYKEKDFTKYANRQFGHKKENQSGIKRLGCLRLDIDNLGYAFINGFSNQGGFYNTFARTIDLSNILNRFFKFDINKIMEKPSKRTFVTYDNNSSRNITIIYSGGDDVFAIGSWDDIIDFAIDFYNQFQKLSNGKLKFSAGISMFRAKFPISQMAKITGGLEDAAKNNKDKNSICLFDERNVFSWEDFVLNNNSVISKYNYIKDFFRYLDEDFGKTFIYRLLGLLRNENKITLSRWAYVLSRAEGKTKESSIEHTVFNEFKEKLFNWFNNKNSNDKEQLLMALELYIYKIRKEND